MKRSLERNLIYGASVWQIISGLITIFFYSNYIKSQGTKLDNPTFSQIMGMDSVFSSYYTFIVTFGSFFILIALINIFIVQKHVKDDSLQYKIPIYWLFLAVLFYFLSDYLSLLLTSIAAVIALSKNKAIKEIVGN